MIDVRIYSRNFDELDDQTRKEISSKINEIKQRKKIERDACIEEFDSKIYEVIKTQKLEKSVKKGRKLLHKKGGKINKKVFATIRELDLDFTDYIKDLDVLNRLAYLNEKKKSALTKIEKARRKETDLIKKCENLPSGVLKTVKIYIAQKRKVMVGDKLAGRHGNKGVISKIAAIEDMPFKL